MSNPIVEMFTTVIDQRLDNGFSPAGNWLNGTLRAVAEGEVSVDYEVRKEMTNPAGTVHGGMLSLFCDEVIGMCCYSLHNEYHFTSINLNIDFLSVAKQGDILRVHAKAVRKGRTIINLECTVKHQNGKLVAKAQQNMARTHVKLR